MSDIQLLPQDGNQPPAREPPTGGEPATPMTGGQKAWLATRVVLKRVRFFAILAAVGLFIGYWDTIKNHWDKYTRPRAVAARQLEPDQEFFCPMHPNVVRSTYEPNGDVPKCPICGMPLSVRKKGEKQALPPGVASRAQFSPDRVQLAGIKTVPIGFRPLAKETATVGFVAFDESRRSQVTSRVAGYVEKLHVDKTFLTVRQGDPLAEVYSPELYSAAQELLLAARRGPTSDLAASARKKLSLLGVSEPEIEAILQSGTASPRLALRSPQSGYVIEKRVVAGSRVEAGMTLLEVADLARVWVEADVFEKDVGFLQTGQKAEAAVEAFPGRVFHGRLALIYPQLDAATRTNRVRFEVDNPGHDLRPGMYATVRLQTPLEAVEPYRSLAADRAKVLQVSTGGKAPQSEVLAVPERAVIDTGAKQVVYIEREAGLFEGVEVQLGPRVGEFYPVLKGLQPGDRVAAAGAFLIDAETRLNPAAASSYFGASGGPQGGSRGSEASGAGQRKEEAPKPKPREPSAEDRNRVAELPEPDRQLALAQKFCPILDQPLGSMGMPYKITLRGKPVFLCCKGCAGKAKRAPEETLRKLGIAQGEP